MTRDERAKSAVAHTAEMKQKFSREIEMAISATKVYHRTVHPASRPIVGSAIRVVPLDSVSAILKFAKGKAAVLNFASYRNPGGGFLNGSVAQEECLCQESWLYNVLSEFPNFYEWNKKHVHNSLYLDRALYTPEVMFMRGPLAKKCDVITCAAPNWSAARNVVDWPTNWSVLHDRIKFVLDIAKDNSVETLILGAFGCGVFAQDAATIATMFKEELEDLKCFETVIFAIPDGKDGNFRTFKTVFSNE